MAGDLWFGDLVRAQARLGVTDPATIREVAALLGLTGPPDDEGTAVPPDPGPSRRPGRDRAADPARIPEPPAPPAPFAPPVPPRWRPRRPGTSVRPLTPDDPEPLPWGDVVRLPPSEERHLRARPPHEPLFARSSTRAIITAMLSRWVPDGPVDVAALLDTIARGRPVREIPREPVPTSRYGVQVLVDRGADMEPFRRDQDVLVEDVRKVMGASVTDVRYFAGTPSDGCGADDEEAWEPYRPPAAGGRVLVLSGFGLGARRDRRAAWEACVRDMRWRGCAPVGLVPAPPDRRPAWLTALLPLVTWDRRTTAGHVGARSSWG
ncbi:hypothetical protein ACFXGA_25195 [Actinosynnema sp. NPDC059335]|uniref:hypothetical protein n=1 Tax=Actinosynnema sp. NPDC059335 TaxID=3346804 RepID=UPI00366C7EE9